MPTIRTAYLALGSNLGDRRATLESAVHELDRSAGVMVRTVSTLLETEPVGPAGQDRYLNAAVAIETSLLPEHLLAQCLAVERAHGRSRHNAVRWGPRTLDIDVLLYGNIILRTVSLTIPHPRMAERAFVLEPLAEIAENVVHPVSNRTIESLRRSLGLHSAGASHT